MGRGDKSKRPSLPIDDNFASIVLTNQMEFVKTHKLKRFLLPDDDTYPPDYAFTANVQKFINSIAPTRVELYKNAMRDIDTVTTLHISSTVYITIVEESIRLYLRKIGKSSSLESMAMYLMEFCSDICCYTRIAYIKGFNPSKYWPIRNICELLRHLRYNDSFFDEYYNELDSWLLEQVQLIERDAGPINLYPIELSIEWIHHPIPEDMTHLLLKSRAYDLRGYCLNVYETIMENIDSKEDILEDVRQLQKAARQLRANLNRMRQAIRQHATSGERLEIADNGAGNVENSYYTVAYDISDVLSSHNDTSDAFSGNYYSTGDLSDDAENNPKAFRSRRKRRLSRRRRNENRKRSNNLRI